MAEYGYILNDILRLGPAKPMGYVPQHTITHLCSRRIESVIKECEDLGYLIEIAAQDVCKILSGAVYVCSPTHLQALLDKNLGTLEEAGWPVHAYAFMLRVTQEWVEPGVAIHDLISKAFGDPNTPNSPASHTTLANGD